MERRSKRERERVDWFFMIFFFIIILFLALLA